jgi:hypothetical protein
MKIIITEAQHNKLQMKQWLLRRQELFMGEYGEALRQISPCNHDDSESYISMVIHYTMDGLHFEYYLIDTFDYDLLYDVILDIFYADLVEKYNSEIKNCQ